MYMYRLLAIPYVSPPQSIPHSPLRWPKAVQAPAAPQGGAQEVGGDIKYSQRKLYKM